MQQIPLTPTFQKALDEYVDVYMGSRNLARRSRVEYTHDVSVFLAYLQETRTQEFRDVTPNHIHNYLARLDRENLAGVTRRKKLTILGVMILLKITCGGVIFAVVENERLLR